jgi:hypothetical protein
LIAAKKLNMINGVFVYISLRQDMYDNLQDLLRDMEKIKEEFEVLSWDKSLLKALICRRVKGNKEYREKVIREMNNDDIIELLFEPEVFNVILAYTLQRPRELIYLCNKLIEEYGRGRDDDYDRMGRINLTHFEKIKYQISEYRLNELCSEYEYELQNLKEFISFFEGGKVEYSSKEFIEFVELAVISLIDECPGVKWSEGLLDKPFDIVKKLHKIGFIKICVSPEKKYFAAYEHSPISYKNIFSIRINDVFISGLECYEEEF